METTDRDALDGPRQLAGCETLSLPGQADTSGGMFVRCPHCHCKTQLADGSPLREIACTSCDGSFNLAETVAHEPSKSKLVGHFELLERLGKGAFGVVWKARDTRLDRIVALKVPLKGQIDEQAAEQFFREARAAAQLRHPHIVAVHEVGRAGDDIYIVSDLIDGVTGPGSFEPLWHCDDKVRCAALASHSPADRSWP